VKINDVSREIRQRTRAFKLRHVYTTCDLYNYIVTCKKFFRE